MIIARGLLHLLRFPLMPVFDAYTLGGVVTDQEYPYTVQWVLKWRKL
jgi:hypothetical protein